MEAEPISNADLLELPCDVLVPAALERQITDANAGRLRCRIVAELWSFENVKSFVQEGVGVAIVPGVTVKQELRDGTLVRVPLKELAMPRRTLMIYREDGYLSKPAAELIKLVRNFNWEAASQPTSHSAGTTIGTPARFAPKRTKR